MKLSEAIMLGSVTVKMIPGDWNSCALGAAANAMSIPLNLNHWSTKRMRDIERVWPWLTVDAPGDMPDLKFGANVTAPMRNRITMRFDDLVCEGKMTFEQLVDYVRSIEPECGECNQFQCVCKSQTDSEDCGTEMTSLLQPNTD